MVSPAEKLLPGTVMRLSSPTSVPRSTVVTVIAAGAVVSGIDGPAGSFIGGVVPAFGSSTGSSFLQPARATAAARAAASRVMLGMLRFMGVLLGGRKRCGSVVERRQLQHLARLDRAGVVELVAIGFVDRVPAAGLAVVLLRDRRKRVALEHRVGAGVVAGSGRNGVDVALHVGEVGLLCRHGMGSCAVGCRQARIACVKAGCRS